MFNKKRVLYTAGFLLLSLLLTISAVSAFWPFDKPKLSPNPSTDVQLTVGNSAPIVTINSVNGGVPVTLNPGGTQPVTVTLNVQDPNGPAPTNIVESTLTITLTSQDNPSETRNLALVSTDCSTFDSVNYNCVIDMEYYDKSGIWDAVASIADTSAAVGTSELFPFNVNQLLDIAITTPISFGTVAAGEQDRIIITPTTITNQGNVEIPADYSLKITGQFLGSTPPGNTIPSSSLNAAGNAGAATVCTAGTTLIDATPVIITGAALTKNPPTNTEDITYCLDVPSPLAEASYSALGGGGLWTIEIA